MYVYIYIHVICVSIYICITYKSKDTGIDLIFDTCMIDGVSTSSNEDREIQCGYHANI